MFFAKKAADQQWIDYSAAVHGALRLVPEGEALNALAGDYARIVDDGLLLDDAEPFDILTPRCSDIATRVKGKAG